VVTGSVAVIAALIVHASSEGFAMTALLSGERRGKAAALLATTCLSPAAGAIAVSQVRLPAQAAPIVTALVAGVLLRVATTAAQAALDERRVRQSGPPGHDPGHWPAHGPGPAGPSRISTWTTLSAHCGQTTGIMNNDIYPSDAKRVIRMPKAYTRKAAQLTTYDLSIWHSAVP